MKTLNTLLAVAATAAALTLANSCADNDSLYDKVDDLVERVDALEKKVDEINKVTIPGMQSIVASIQGKIYVNSVTPGDDGYTITFSDGTTAVITNGIDGDKGEKGDTPAIGVIEADGEFYWAVDGNPLLDSDGNKIPVHSAIPQLRISEGKWQVSYDKGATWSDVTVLGNPGGSTISIEDGDTTVTFFINGEAYTIQKELPFYLVFDARKDLGVPVGDDEYTYPYSLKGVSEGDEVEVDILNCTAGWEARVITLPKGEVPGYIGVKHNENKTGKVFVYASNGRGKTDIKSLVFEDGVLTAEADVKPVPAAGGEVTVSVTTNMDYELYVDRTQKWISVAPKTKATHTDVYTLVCEANETGTFRSAEVDVINTVTGETPEVFYVLQYPAETVTTDIASLENVADNTPVALYKETVLASSEKSAVVSDGTSYLVVTGLETALPVGKEITLNGVKNTDAETDLVSLTYTSHEVSAETSAVTNPAPVYIGMAYYTIPSYTIASGKLSQSEGVYYITAPMGQTVVFEAPSASFSLASKVGSYVSAYGYVVDYAFTGEDDPETDTMILTAISTVEFKENNAWTLSYSTDPEDADYPEVITNTVSGSTVPYTLGLYSAEGYAEIGGSPVAAALLLGDDLQYYFDLYGDAFDRDELYSIFVHGDGATGSDSFKEIAYGKYVAIAAGIAADGTPTGDYKVFEFEKEKPESSEAYKAWLGNYTISTKSVKTGNDTTYNVVLADGVPDKTILINGLGIDGFPVQYDAENDKCSVVFGKFKGNSSYDFYVSGITNDNYVCTGDPDSGKIATLTKSADRTIKVENVVYKLSDERSEVYAAYWRILAKTAANKWYTFSDVNYVVNPATMTPAAATKAIKSVSAPNACQSVRFDSKTLPAPDTKCGKVDARIAKSGRASLLELK